jgi:signal transduction histidine kinase
MTPAFSRRLARSCLALCVIACAGASALAIANPTRTSVAATVAGFVSLLIFPVVGALIASRRPSSPIGWLLIVTGLALELSGGLADEYAHYSVEVHHLPAAGLALGLTNTWWAIGLGALAPFTLLLFPDGHPPSPRWRWVLRLGGTGIILMLLGGTFSRVLDAFPHNPLNPIGFLPKAVAGGFLQLGAMLFIPSIPVSAVGLVLRLRRSRGTEREQIKWLAFGGSILALGLIVGMALDAAGHEAARENVLGFATAAIPISAGIAILRARVFDIDVVIKKTMIVGLLVVVMGVFAAGTFFILGQFALWGGTSRSVSVSVGIAVGLLFVPVLRLSRKIADRVVYGKRATPYEVLTGFSERLAETYSTEDVLSRMAAILGAGTGAEHVAVWLAIGRELRPQAEWPERGERSTPFPLDDLSSTGAFEVRHLGELLGAITVEMHANDPMNNSKERLVRDLAAQAGLVLRNVKLIEDLRASRQRLVAAQDDERRKIERDLHDGAQQQLVALAVKLRLARQLADRDVEGAKRALDELAGDATGALEDLRDLARGIYPPLLADRGLAEALEAQARKSAIPVEVETNGTVRYPREIESAVYFCVLEALNNVAKYAEASGATVRLGSDEGALTFSVQDDGRGFEPGATSYGTGLQGMADRLDAIGGSLGVESSPGAGTTVTGRVPTPALRGASEETER